MSADEDDSFDKRFGECLVHLGKLDDGGLQRALRAQIASDERLHRLLPKLGLVSESDVAEALAATLDLELVSPRDYPDEPAHDNRLSVNFLKSSKIIPISDTDQALTVAMPIRVTITLSAPFNSTQESRLASRSACRPKSRQRWNGCLGITRWSKIMPWPSKPGSSPIRSTTSNACAISQARRRSSGSSIA